MRTRSAVVVVALTLAACGGELDTDANVESAPAGPLATGQELYEQNCAECHGIDLRGTDKGPSHLSILYEPSHHADGAFQIAALRGVREHHWNFGDMPPVPNLDTDDIAAITAYVRSVQQREGFEPYPP